MNQIITIKELVAQYEADRKAENEAKERASRSRQAILDALDHEGSDVILDGDKVVVSRKAVQRISLDAKLVKALAPATYEKASRLSEYFRLSVGK